MRIIIRYLIFISSCSFAMEKPVHKVCYAPKEIEEKALYHAVAGNFDRLAPLLQQHVFRPECMVRLVQNSLNNGLPYAWRMIFIIKLLEIGVPLDKPIGGKSWGNICLLGYVIRTHPQYIKPMLLFGAPAHEFFAADAADETDMPKIMAARRSEERALLLKWGNHVKAFFHSQATGKPMQLLRERQKFMHELNPKMQKYQDNIKKDE